VTGFRTRFLLPLLQGESGQFTTTRDDLLAAIPPAAVTAVTTHHRQRTGTVADLASALAATLSDPTWIEVPELAEQLERPLVELAYRYLAEETDAGGKPVNPVAGFHLGNGARITKRHVNFGANTSRRGLLEGCGIMVNYLYSPSTLSRMSTTLISLLPWVGR
jgi:hypothetical protein